MASQTVAIRIPKLNVDTKVIEIYLSNSSWDISSLDQNVGHLEGTPDFQTQDNVVLTGYSQTADGEPGVFANLPTLSSGDEVVISLDGKDSRYSVTDVRRVRYDDFSILDTATVSRLTLLTSAVDSYDESEGDYLERHVVIAEPVLAAEPKNTPLELPRAESFSAPEEPALTVESSSEDAVFSW